MEKPDLSLYPNTPGVYLYKNATGKIIYVGKAKRLRHRIASYFRPEATLPIKTRLMMNSATTLDILNTATEKEALLLETSLIKKHHPRYNILLRDDKDSLLFRIGNDHPYPRVEIIRHSSKKRKKGGQLFGPFSSGSAARETWRLLHRYFPLRRCHNRAFANRTRPCLYHDMGQCLAPCVLPVSVEIYQEILDKVRLFLLGRSRQLVKELHHEMLLASEKLLFEQAARLRDQIKAIKDTIERQSVVLQSGTDIDLLGVAQIPEGLVLGIVFVRDGLLIDGKNYFWPALTVENTPELLYSFMGQYYLAENAPIPQTIVVPWLPKKEENSTIRENFTCFDGTHNSKGCGGADASNSSNAFGHSGAFDVFSDNSNDFDDLENWQESFASMQSALTERREGVVYMREPKKPDEDRLILLAATNAKDHHSRKKRPELAEKLAKLLHSPKPINRIEMVDISHTSGKQTKAGMVVFEQEEPDTKSYRIYNLDEYLAHMEAKAGDDYTALAIFTKRRIKSGPPWPDLLLIDGGKGQLAAVQRALLEENAEPFLIASIAKARTEEGKPDRRAGNVSDRIFLPNRNNPVSFAQGSPELLYLQHIRDTAHDFVIGRHRRARAAATLAGELTRLPGVGPKLAQTLFQHFGSLSAMAKADQIALQAVPGVGKARAAMLHERLQLLVEE